jgi:hypothetical protein
MRINLRFRELLDMELYEKGFQHWVIRIIARTRFKTQEGWTEVTKLFF